MITKVQNIVFLRPSLKNNLFAVARLTVLTLGRYIGRNFLQTGWNGRDFKYTLKKGMAFIPVYFSFNSSSMY